MMLVYLIIPALIVIAIYLIREIRKVKYIEEREGKVGCISITALIIVVFGLVIWIYW